MPFSPKAAHRLSCTSVLVWFVLLACGARTSLEELPGNALAATCGAAHTCALTIDHRLSCWGANQYGQLGNPDRAGSAVPTAFADPTFQPTAVSAGDDHTCAVQSSGADASCWGDGISGELGGEPRSAVLGTPVDLGALRGQVRVIGAGDQFSCALLSSGRVSCWGANAADECGTGSGEPVIRAPVEVQGLTLDTVAIAVGGSHACALSAAGAVRCWGSHEFGQTGPDVRAAGEVRVPLNLPRISGIASGLSHSCALTTAGRVKCWGNNAFGQLGDRSTRDSSAPVDVAAIEGVARLATGSMSHLTCALDAAGRMKCWGFAGTDLIARWSAADGPITIPGLNSPLESIAMGSRHACAVTRSGYLLCWGNNEAGQLGTGPSEGSTTPNLVRGL
jgi:alpha-tubulin suppressor-like RCC1 family protein